MLLIGNGCFGDDAHKDSFQTQKDIQFRDWTRPNGCIKLRIAERLNSRHMKVVMVVSLTHWLPLHSRIHPW